MATDKRGITLEVLESSDHCFKNLISDRCEIISLFV